MLTRLLAATLVAAGSAAVTVGIVLLIATLLAGCASTEPVVVTRDVPCPAILPAVACVECPDPRSLVLVDWVREHQRCRIQNETCLDALETVKEAHAECSATSP